MAHLTQREVLLSLINHPEQPLLRRFDGSLFNPGAVLEEIEHHYRGLAPCFLSTELDSDCRKIGPGRFSFFRYGWLEPVFPALLNLPEDNSARLNPLNSRIVTHSIAHVDPAFRTVQYRGVWWLYLLDKADPPMLVSPDYYLMRRVQTFEQLQVILEEEAAELDALEDAEIAQEAPDPENPVPLHVWGETFGPGSYQPN